MGNGERVTGDGERVTGKKGATVGAVKGCREWSKKEVWEAKKELPPPKKPLQVVLGFSRF
jgi:hypothetical protein